VRSPEPPAVRICGLVDRSFDVPLAQLEKMSRRQLTADFHCVAGWSAREVGWEGVSFRLFYDTLIGPRVAAGANVTHLLLEGADGWKADVLLEDARADNVLLADRLDGDAITEEHGSPLRFVSPDQYGYKNVKHLVKIELHDQAPSDLPGPLGARLALFSVRAHPRARVALEERHRYLPAPVLRWPYRNVIYPAIAVALWLEEFVHRGGRG